MLFFIAQEIRHDGAGILRDGNPLDSTLYGKLVRADANVRASVALGGTFVTSMGAITSLDVSVRSAQAAIEAKTLEIDDSRFERSARLGAPEIPYTWPEKRGYDRL
ncbi:MAG: hypothetical protein HY899_02585 [Deltaproteobacteria bacterium]|nr:hypothetical protein [Deltaproteobacteria bacterium]